MNMSIVEYFADNAGSQCGYCRGKTGSFSHGMWGHVLTCPDYQGLIDRGWRRSGRYCYKPTLDKTCCPQYTIKCDAIKFQLTKSQKKILKKFRNFIMDGNSPTSTSSAADNVAIGGDSDSDISEGDDDEEDNNMDTESAATQNKAESLENKLKLVQPEQATVNAAIETSTSSTSETDNFHVGCATIPVSTIPKSGVKPGLGADPSKPKAKKKKEIRKEKALAKLLAAGKTPDQIQKKNKNDPKTLEELTSVGFPPHAKHKFEIRLVNAQTSDVTFNESYIDSYNVYKKYQMVIHNDAPSKCTVGQFKRFLCNSSLLQTDTEKEYRYGAFHQQYLIDDKIVAVGVIDILPSCVSSVYLYYDPDYAFLSPGTLTSLFEIAFTRKLQKEHFPNLIHYYMGFYIHSCPKMRYKAKYTPSWLLCPVTYRWVSVKDAVPLLDKSKFAKLNIQDGNGHSGDQIDVDDVLILYENQAMPFRHYQNVTKVNEFEKNEVMEYSNLIGGNLSKKILLYRG